MRLTALARFRPRLSPPPIWDRIAEFLPTWPRTENVYLPGDKPVNYDSRAQFLTEHVVSDGSRFAENDRLVYRGWVCMEDRPPARPPRPGDTFTISDRAVDAPFGVKFLLHEAQPTNQPQLYSIVAEMCRSQ